MFILSRRQGERIVVDGNIWITYQEFNRKGNFNLTPSAKILIEYGNEKKTISLAFQTSYMINDRVEMFNLGFNRGNTIKLGFNADKKIVIDREEIFERRKINPSYNRSANHEW